MKASAMTLICIIVFTMFMALRPAPAQAQSSGGPGAGFFGGSSLMRPVDHCYWYPRSSPLCPGYSPQPCYISIRQENGIKRVPCGTFLNKQRVRK
jgi:hypothetical protein